VTAPKDEAPVAAAAAAAEKSIDDELAELRAQKERSEQARAKARKQRELEVLRLEMKHEAALGPRGSMFEIVDPRDAYDNPIESPIVVRLGEGVLFQRFTASKVTATDVHDFVFPCLESDKNRYLEIVANRPEIAGRCAHALMTLFGAKHKDDTGKF